ncbi:MAG: UvrD-helicase domain-containing protein [bacterium]|nr:UvrD-helicase domain-containing protein [bacterium]
MAKKQKSKDLSQIDIFDEIHDRQLTDEQREFIEFKGKESVILSAVAGSGKTFSCVERLKNLMRRGVDPSKIIFFSFTKAATEELKSRIGNDDIKITTIHSFCYYVLNRAGKWKEVTRWFDFVKWYKEQFSPPRHASPEAKEEFYMNINEMYTSADVISSKIAAYKLMQAEGEKALFPDFFLEYERFQKETYARDFSDMLIEVDKLFKEDKWLKMFKGKYDYIFVDEFQDTSALQLRCLLALNARYYYLIGDIFQCTPKGSLIDTPNGQTLIENLSVGDHVVSCVGENRVSTRPITKIDSHKIVDHLVKVTTESGRVVTCTKSHDLFIKYKKHKDSLFFVYLMYRADLGYRIGITRSKPNETDDFGFAIRFRQESAEKLWILDVCSSEKEARLREVVLSLEYQIPTCVFTARGGMQDQAFINKVFNQISTRENAEQLLSDYGLKKGLAHYVGRSIHRNIKNVTLCLCANGRSVKSSHTLEFGTGNEEHKSLLEASGVKLQTSKKGWRIRKQSPSYQDILNSAYQIEEAIQNVYIRPTAKLTRGSKSLEQLPASYAKKGMSLTVVEDGKPREELIVDVSSEKYEGLVYDIDVENTHNFCVDGVVVHNSIYGYSGANAKRLVNMLAKRRKVKEMTLTVNFRSDIEIVNNSNSYSELEAQANSPMPGEVDYIIRTSTDELISIMETSNECAVLVRTNSVIRQLEKKLLIERYPMRYENYLTKKDLEDLKEKKINPILDRKIRDMQNHFDSPEELVAFIKINQDSKKFITTIHKSKGREFEDVIVVNSCAPEILIDNGFVLPKKELKKVSFDYDAKDREAQNIHYVAVTRPKHRLYYMLWGKV